MRTSVQTAGSVQGLASREVIVEGATSRSPLMLIHGAWLSARSWDPFAEYFRERGYEVSAPEWPRKQGDVEELREATDAIAGLGLAEIVDQYEEQIRALEQEPILIGHSFGGLIVGSFSTAGLPGRRRDQPGAAEGNPRLAVLVAQGCLPGTGAPVALARRRAAHARGVHLRFREHVHARGGEGRVREVLRPGDRQIFIEAGFTNFHLHPPTELHFKYEERAPLLIIGADQDHTVPASVAKKQFKKYEKSPAQTDYLEFAAGHT